MNLPIIHQNPEAVDFVQDPYSAYQNWRETPFFYWQDYQLIASTQYETVNTLLRDRRFGRQAPEGFAPQYPKALQPFYEFEARSMLELDGADHQRLRNHVLRAFTSRRIAHFEGEIEGLAHALIDKFPAKPFDLLPSFAEKIPVIIISRLIGAPEEDADQLLKWSHDMVAIYQARRDAEIEKNAVASTLAFADYIRALLKAHRKQSQDDLISALLVLPPEKISEDEIITSLILLLNAGHEATVHGIGNGVRLLLNERILDPSQMNTQMVDEILRFDPPLHMFTRFALEDVEIFGYDFKRGDKLALMLAAANRDPRHYPRADVFDPSRKATDHLAFGAGAHFCLGAPLAKMEMKTALQVLFSRCPNLTLSGESRFANRYHFHGLEALWVKV